MPVLYALFVDLRKAYDSIPRLALWLLLERVGVPPVMLNIIKSLHEGMRVKIRSDGGTSEAFPVTNGLCQGCTMAPVLFNIYFSAVISHWRSMCPDVGVAVSVAEQLHTIQEKLPAFLHTHSQL